MSEMECTGGAVRHGSSTSSSPLNCKFLGSLSSPRGRDLLSQLCLQIAQQSKLRHHFVERKDLDRISRQLCHKSIEKVIHRTRSSHARQPNEETVPLKMKVFFVRDQLERLSDEQVPPIYPPSLYSLSFF